MDAVGSGPGPRVEQDVADPDPGEGVPAGGGPGEPARPGPRELGLRIVRRGLEPSDRIVINGLMRVRPGIEVTPVPGQIELPAPPAAS